MPTAAKLISAILLAGLGYYTADLVGGHLRPEQTQGYLRPIPALFGIWLGWRFLGRRATGEWRSAIGLGLSAVAFLSFVSMVWFAGYEMIIRAMRLSYGGDPFAAIKDMVQIGIENLEYVLHPDVIIAAVGGGIVIGIVVTAVARRFP